MYWSSELSGIVMLFIFRQCSKEWAPILLISGEMTTSSMSRRAKRTTSKMSLVTSDFPTRILSSMNLMFSAPFRMISIFLNRYVSLQKPLFISLMFDGRKTHSIGEYAKMCLPMNWSSVLGSNFKVLIGERLKASSKMEITEYSFDLYIIDLGTRTSWAGLSYPKMVAVFSSSFNEYLRPLLMISFWDI